MIKLTYHQTNDIVHINVDAIKSFACEGSGTVIRYTDGMTASVTESPETVARLITEYKQRQMRLQALYGIKYSGWKSGWNEEISKLESEDRG